MHYKTVSNVLKFKKEDDGEPSLVVVHWLDITATADWTEGEEVEPTPFQTVGWLHTINDSVIKVGNTMDEENKIYGITCFPIGCVEQIQELQLSISTDPS